MNFVTLDFACFLVPALLLLRLTRTRPAWHLPALIACNLWFYAATGMRGVAVLTATAVIAWLGGLWIGSGSGRRGPVRLWAPVLSCLGLLAFFKYNEAARLLLWHAVGPLLSGDFAKSLLETDFPYIAGISFFVFQAISYLVDVHRGVLRPEGFLRVLAWLSFFPLVMSGPIARAGEFIPQIADPQEDRAAVDEGILLILAGLFKKVAISSYLSEHVVRQVFDAPESCSSLTVAVGLYAYGMQIYCDFSGYTDMAVGVARLLGYRLPKNFDAPYMARSIRDFWRRWHITLSSWYRDYVYIPLGGSRRGSIHANLLATMILCGLWHGGAAGYLIWGALHGAGLCIQRAIYVARNGRPLLPAWAGWLLTFHFVILLWAPFKAESPDKTADVLGRLIACTPEGDGFPLLAPAVILLCLAMQRFGGLLPAWCGALQARMSWRMQGIVAALLAAAILAMGPDGVLPFIYFGF